MYKVTQVKELTIRDIQILDMLIVCSFSRSECYDKLFPEKMVGTSNVVKNRYFFRLFHDKKDLTYEYIDNFYKTKFKEQFLSKERILLELLDTAQQAKRAEEFSAAISAYKLISDILGMNITGKLQQNPSVVIISVPNQDNSNLINEAMDMISIGPKKE